MARNNRNTKQNSLLSLAEPRIKVREPASPLMKAVARRTMDMRRMKKDFTPEEIEEIVFKRQDGNELSKVEVKALRD